MNALSPRYWQDLVEAIGHGWNRFWFTAIDPLPLAVLRFGTGLVTLLHLLSFNRDLTRWFAANGILPAAVIRNLDALAGSRGYDYSFLFYVQTPTELWLVHVAALVIALAFTLGFLTRVTSVLTLLIVLNYSHRAPMLTGQLEPVLSMLLFYLCFGPAGARLSVDSLLLPRFGWKSPERSVAAGVVIRLIQVHGAAFYAMFGLTKLFGEAWWSGDAIWLVLAQTHSRPINLSWLRDYPRILNAWTHAIVAYELLFPVLIWNRYARPLLLALGVVIWLSIGLITGLVPWALAMLLVNRAFVPAEDIDPEVGAK
jgi:hypothetical protein